MALVPLQDAWIVANYKESQLTHIRPGQKVEFTVDAYPGRRFTGRVDSIMAGTGAAFSLLPPENATGNYVKVVQRVPVKILIDSNSDPEHLLRVGMSVVPTVLVGRSKGEVLKELNPFK
jgi:membrane fusion protein (multidrug efflux system)